MTSTQIKDHSLLFAKYLKIDSANETFLKADAADAKYLKAGDAYVKGEADATFLKASDAQNQFVAGDGSVLTGVELASRERRRTHCGWWSVGEAQRSRSFMARATRDRWHWFRSSSLSESPSCGPRASISRSSCETVAHVTPVKVIVGAMRFADRGTTRLTAQAIVSA